MFFPKIETDIAVFHVKTVNFGKICMPFFLKLQILNTEFPRETSMK